MLIQNDSKLTAIPQSENLQPIKEGGTYTAVVKEKLPNYEAIVQVKGQEVRVKIEGGSPFPESGKINMQVTDMKQELPVVKAVPVQVVERGQAAQQQGLALSNNVKQAVELLNQKNIPITKDILTHIKNYVEKGTGSQEQKVETITHMAAKKLDFTPQQLRAVHEALHGRPLGQVLQDLVAELDPNFSVKKEAGMQEPLQAKVAQVLSKLETMVRDSAKIEMIQNLRQALQQGDSPANIARVISSAFTSELRSTPALAREVLAVLKEVEMVRPTANETMNRAPQSSAPQSVTQQDSVQLRINQVLTKLEQTITDPAKKQKIQQLARSLQQGARSDVIARSVISEFSTELKADSSLAENLRSSLSQARPIFTGSQTVNAGPGVTNQQSVNTTQIVNQISQDETANKPGMAGGQSPVKIQNENHSIQSDIKAAAKQVKTVPDLSRVLQFVKDSSAFTELPTEQRAILHQAVEKAEQLQTAGKELAARQELASALSQLEGKQPEKVSQEAEQAYRFSNEVLATIPVQSRDLVVTTITKKLSQAAIDFKAVKRDITNTLQTAENLMKQAPMHARPSLEAAIKQLDNAILKSDFMLYTDMGTEKKLLLASTQLHEARKLLGKGEFAKASEIVHQVRNTVDKLIFQPSDVRVKHFVSKELAQLEQLPLPKQLSHSLEEPLQSMRQEPTARNAFEYVRSLGLTYDSDIAHRLVAGENAKADADASLKNMLMKLIQSEGNSSAGQKAEQALQHITGQQLLSKTDTTGLQTMMFSLPMILREQMENVKVFLTSKNSSERIDWENCSLYFLLETKRMGDVGIQLTAVDRTLSVTIKNDSLGFQEKIGPLAEVAKRRLEDIGYKIGAIQFTDLTPAAVRETAEKQSEKVNQPAFTERGYDFSV
ncbi:hypothetical protein [Lederbergia citrea]|uniref:Flagellar hook-length control protein-like C-terminal domain-containing protein n=1 Tax=Lederbergia citrea TaxID=2833581 RepID=A0A942Z427_9BACI|nr:hypothetical protein [Lederbergia citrea]MBS4223199.1 hypothetical protein [Lederbergia citrea]